MIVVDTSAIASIFFHESDAAIHAGRIEDDEEALFSAASMLETSIVLRRRKMITADAAEAWLNEMIAVLRIEVEPVTVEQIQIARHAHLRFGKGTGHPAQLNFGDCFAYALAKAMSAPLLFKGEDFAHTDIAQALWPAGG